MTSRLQILDYCWRCLQNGNPNFSSHIYTNCTEFNFLENSTQNQEEEEEEAEEEEEEDISWEEVFYALSDVYDAEANSRMFGFNVYFSDNDDDDNFKASENIVDIDSLMFGFELTKTVLDMCPVCLEENIEPEDTTTLDCNHTFCNPCLTRIILNCNLVCALCRSQINLKNI